MDNLNQTHSGTGDNVGGDKITNNIQVNNDKLIRRAQEAYSKIYHWHKKYGKKIFSDFYEDEYGEDFSSEYYDLVETLPAPEIAELTEMIAICKNFYNGVLSWSSSETVEPIKRRQRLIKFANEVINSEKKFTAKMFKEIDLHNQHEYYDKSKEILFETNKELREVEKEYQSDDRLGGLNAIIESSKEFESPIILTPELLGYKIVEGNDTLVEHVKNNRVRLDNITLNTYPEEVDESSRRSDYFVDVELTNLTDSSIEVQIPEGQIFENREYQYEDKPSQNLATAESKSIIIEANESVDFQIPAFCMNREYHPPQEKDGNLTIYEMLKKGFQDNKQLWKWVKKNYENIIKEFK